ncbi:unnamed protein product [Ascophyllum nodosum]
MWTQSTWRVLCDQGGGVLLRNVSSKGAAGEKKKLVILGTGWGGFRLAREVDKKRYEVTVVSPRNHFLFTPLLPSTTVGTLEFRCIQEPVRTIKGLTYLQAHCADVRFMAYPTSSPHCACTNVDFHKKTLRCQEVFKGILLDLDYDYLVIATGAQNNTFGVPGVKKENNVHFLKQLGDARDIRNRLLDCFERAANPFLSDQERSRLLSFIVVGGGPTSVEYAAELHDFLTNDVKRWYPDLQDKVSVHLVEASDQIMGSFEEKLVEYTTRLLENRKVNVLLNTAVQSVGEKVCTLVDGRKFPFGLMVWSTGLAPLDLVKKMDVAKDRGRIAIDDWLRVTVLEGVFAMGDAAVNPQKPLGPLAQVADQQGKYLAKLFSKLDPLTEDNPPFHYRYLGSMAHVGGWKAVAEFKGIGSSGDSVSKPGLSLEGILAFATWRSAYWTKTVSIANKVLIPMHWFKAWAFGRDISRF